MTTGELRSAIHHTLDLLETAIEHASSLCAGSSLDGESREHVVKAREAVLMHALLTALYVCELTKRPVPQVAFSAN